MTWQFMLDTNIVSDLIRHPRGRIRQRLSALGPLVACVSIVTAAELCFGAAKAKSEPLRVKVETALVAVLPLPLTEPVDDVYASLRADLEARGTPISYHDLLIAAHALALDLTLVTANTREFSRVPDLRVENWLD